MDPLPQVKVALTSRKETRSAAINTDDKKPTKDPYPSFSRFMQLPPELRLEVWKYVLQDEQPQLIHPRLSLARPWIVGITIAKSPAMLYTCIESRIEALKQYSHSLKVNDQSYRIDLHHDCIFIDQNSIPDYRQDILGILRRGLKAQRIPRSEIKHLATDYRWTACLFSGYFETPHALRHFDNLDTLAFISGKCGRRRGSQVRVLRIRKKSPRDPAVGQLRKEMTELKLANPGWKEPTLAFWGFSKEE